MLPASVFYLAGIFYFILEFFSFIRTWIKYVTPNKPFVGRKPCLAQDLYPPGTMVRDKLLGLFYNH